MLARCHWSRVATPALTKLVVAILFSLSSHVEVDAGIMSPVGITSQGSFSNSQNLLIDGFFPAEASVYASPETAYWSNQEGPNGVSFTIDYGQAFRLEDILVSVDNNDFYRVEYSLTPANFTSLFTIARSDGEVGFGMDTMSSDVSNGEYVSNIDFAPVEARFLRIYATGGDRLYSIGEVRAFGTPASSVIPEPSSFALVTLAGLGIVIRRRRS